MSTPVSQRVRLLSFQALRCLTPEAHDELEDQVGRLMGSGRAHVVEPFHKASGDFKRLTDIQGTGRFELTLEDGAQLTGMCSASLPADLLVTWTPEHRTDGAALTALYRQLYGDLEQLDLVHFYDLAVLSVVTDDVRRLLESDIRHGEAWMQPTGETGVIRLSLPVGDLVVIVGQDEDTVSELQARAIDIARVHGGCRDLIYRLTAHRRGGIAPLTDALVDAPLSDGLPEAAELVGLVAQRQTLLALERDLAALERDGDCLHEYAADLERRLAAAPQHRSVLGTLHQELAQDELAPLQMLLAQTRSQHAAASAYFRDQIDLAYAETNLRISETNLEISHNVRRLQVWQILLTIAVLALTVVQVVQAIR